MFVNGFHKNYFLFPLQISQKILSPGVCAFSVYAASHPIFTLFRNATKTSSF